MNYQQTIILLVILFMIASLYKGWFGSGFTFIIGISVFGITGVLTQKEIMSGFANEQ